MLCTRRRAFVLFLVANAARSHPQQNRDTRASSKRVPCLHTKDGKNTPINVNNNSNNKN